MCCVALYSLHCVDTATAAVEIRMLPHSNDGEGVASIVSREVGDEREYIALHNREEHVKKVLVESHRNFVEVRVVHRAC